MGEKNIRLLPLESVVVGSSVAEEEVLCSVAQSMKPFVSNSSNFVPFAHVAM